MPFHATLADAALRDGNTPEQFRAAAQRHANAFWFYAAIAGGLWYFLDWRWALLPLGLAALVAVQGVSSTLVARRLEQRTAARDQPVAFDLNDPADVALIDRIRAQYSALLTDESHPYSECMYRPAALLPYPKEVIRQALSALLDFVEGRRTSDLLSADLRDPEIADVIRVALNSLEEFVDVPPARLPTNPRENMRVGIELQQVQR